jgi:contractile injection system tube protein
MANPTPTSPNAPDEDSHANMGRRSFLIGAVAGGTLVATHALITAEPAEAAKGTKLPKLRKNKDHVPFDIVPEVGESVAGGLDLTTVAISVDGSGVQHASFELFFDRYEEGKSVREITDKIEKLALVDANLHRPPVCLLTWGTGLSFKCILESFSLRITAFRAEPDGQPQAVLPLGAVMRTTFQVVPG